MRQRFLLIMNSILIVISTIFLSQTEVTIWYQLFGKTPAPMLWLLAVIYSCVYRTASEGLFLVYIISIVVSTLTSKPLVEICALTIFTFIMIQIFKSRIYWEGFRYFALVATVSTFNFHIADIVISYILNDYVFHRIFIFHRFLTLFFTALFSFPVYRLFLWLDQQTEKDRLSVPGSHAI